MAGYISKAQRLLSIVHNRVLIKNARIVTSAVQKSSYTTEEQLKFLEKLNDLNLETSKTIGEKHVKNIGLYKKKHGSIKNLEDLLQVAGIGPKTLRTLCAKLLDKKGEEVVKKTRSRLSVVTPQPNTKIQEFVSINIDVNAVSWSLIDCNKKYLLDWRVDEIGLNRESSSVFPVFDVANKIETTIPKSEWYLFEEPRMFSSSVIQKTADFNHMTCILSSLIYSKKSENLLFLRPKLVERHFQALIGNEKVSLRNFINDIAEQKFSVNHSSLFINNDLYSYYKTSNPYSQEHLAKSCLQGITLIDKVIKKNVSE